MATLDSNHDVASVEPTETFTGDLVEYRFDNPDPEENWQYVFFDLSENNERRYSLMAVLEYLYKNKHSVRITVEDLGESESVVRARERAAAEAKRREEALQKLAQDARDRQHHMVKYQSR
jgi:hypothetical protein